MIPAFPNSRLHHSPGLVTDLSPGSNTFTLLSTAAKLNLRSLALEAPQSSSNSHDLCSSLSRDPSQSLLKICSSQLVYPSSMSKLCSCRLLQAECLLSHLCQEDSLVLPPLACTTHPAFFYICMHRSSLPKGFLSFSWAEPISPSYFFCFKSQLISVCEMKGGLNQGY